MTRTGEKSFSDYILAGKYTKINKFNDFEICKDLKRTRDQEDIILAVNAATKEIEPEKTAIIIGAFITGAVAIPEVMAIIKFLQDRQNDMPSNGIIIGGIFIAVLFGFVVKRIAELMGLSTFKLLATEYLEKEQPKLAPDLYKSKKIVL